MGLTKPCIVEGKGDKNGPSSKTETPTACGRLRWVKLSISISWFCNAIYHLMLFAFTKEDHRFTMFASDQLGLSLLPPQGLKGCLNMSRRRAAPSMLCIGLLYISPRGGSSAWSGGCAIASGRKMIHATSCAAGQVS